ncbi:MAG TPA: GntR family transcriptional regulator [Gemmatimonadaceae bacterium]
MATSHRQQTHRQKTTSDVIADALRADIKGGIAPPGSALRQEELARRFGVSRLPIRDALLRLESEGLVVVYPNRGAFVVSLSAREVAEIYHLRILLEGDMLECAISRMSRDDLRRIDAARAAAAAGAGGPDWASLDNAFHLGLYAPADRPRQLALIASLRGSVDRYWRAYEALPAHTSEWLRDHDDIVAACRAGDAGAARRLLVSHLERAGALVLQAVERDRA